jgi:DNA-binding winged helix-turn-helix (wHTH) protein/tetratricopeptide (TPR) repeat protein
MSTLDAVRRAVQPRTAFGKPSDVESGVVRDRFSVGDWDVRPDSNELVRGRHVVRVEPKVMDALVALSQRPGEVVSREELLAAVWPDVHVSSATVFRLMSELRSALDDTATAPTYVETVPKRGYRLLAPVRRPMPVRRDFQAARLAAGVLVVTALGGAAWSLWAPARIAPSMVSESMSVPAAFERGEVLEHRADCDSFARARAAYDDAIETRPEFAPAHMNLIDTVLASAVLGCMPGVAADERIRLLMERAPTTGIDWHRRRASRAFWFGGGDDAGWLTLSDLDPVADVNRAAVMLVAGRPSEAIAEAERARREESAAIGEMWTLATVQLFSGRASDAIRSFDNLLDLYPGFGPAVSLRLVALWEAGRRDQAAAEARSAVATLRAPVDRFAAVPALVLRWAGETDASAAFLKQWERVVADSEWVPPTGRAVAALAAGDRSSAARWLAEAEAQRDPWMRMASLDPTLRDIR